MKYDEVAQHLMSYAETLDANSQMKMQFRLAAMFFREHEKVIPDNPDWDFTDDAHPAWWRGHENGCALACEAVNEILDGKDCGHCVGVEPWESARQRLLKLSPETMWDKFMSLLNARRPLGTGTVHKSFIGSIDAYKAIFVEANTE